MKIKKRVIHIIKGEWLLKFSIVTLCALTSMMSSAQDVKLVKLKVARSTESPFGAYAYNNELYYCIDRGKKSTKSNENQEGGHFLDLFKIKLKQKNKTTGKAMRLSDTINSNQNEGPLEISRNGSYLFYSKNLIDFKGSSDENKLGIYISKFENRVWNKPVPFPYNNDSFNVAHPTVNIDMDMMIFTSDMPGGFGATDLYVSYKKHGKWEKPKNLNKIINSQWSETFPYFVDNTLYFTSNRDGGVGGMDLYSSKFIDGKWQKPITLKKPINSEFDDFCYFLNDDGKSGYFSTNRNGSDGIYYFEKEIPEPIIYQKQQINFCFTVTDSIIEETDDLEFIWDMGDGTKLKGLSVEHCYQDTGVFVARMSIYEKSIDRTYSLAASSEIVISAFGLPVIEYELKDGRYEFSINRKWEDSDYNKNYWLVNGEKVFEPTLSYSVNGLNSIRLVVWSTKQADSAKGIELTLKR